LHPPDTALGASPRPPLPAESLKEKEALRRAHLRALAAALRASEGARAAAAPLAAPLGRLVGEGCAKAAARVDGLLALAAAAYVAAADLKAGEALAADKVGCTARLLAVPALLAWQACRLEPHRGCHASWQQVGGLARPRCAGMRSRKRQ
jgi:hypothetical protein